MKAVIQQHYGSPDVLDLRDVDRPSVTDDGVLIRVHAASVNRADWIVLTGKPYLVRIMGRGVFTPKHRIPGIDVAGRVEAVGRNVTHFQPGDEVFGDLFSSGLGAYAEFACVPESQLAPKPANLTFEEAAAVPLAATTALQGLRDKRTLRPHERVLINGAAGGVGTFAVQIARAFGADVTGVYSTHSVEMVRSIGADTVIDYTREDFTRTGQRYDLLFDLVGNRSLSDCRRALAPTGTLVMASGNTDRAFGPMDRIVAGLVLSPFVSRKMWVLSAGTTRNDLMQLKELIESGKVKPIVDKRFGLDEVREALRYHGEGHARGKTVIAVERGDRLSAGRSAAIAL